MTESGFCCGQVPQPKNKIVDKNLPENPVIENGVEVIYLGSGGFKIEGISSGLLYYVSDHRRRFYADPKDLDEIMKMRHFILEP